MDVLRREKRQTFISGKRENEKKDTRRKVVKNGIHAIFYHGVFSKKTPVILSNSDIHVA